MISRTTRLVIVLCLVHGSFVMAQKLTPGPQVLTFFSNADDTEQPYGLYLPKNYDPQKKYPLVIMLHGAGSNHRLALRRVFGKSNANGETDVEATRYFPEWKDIDYIVASPFARGTAGYQGIPEKDVYAVLADVKKRFSIDEDRTYLTGLSMGGGGTLWLAMTRPDIWAAIAPVCPAPPGGTDELLSNGLNLPAHFFHGDADQAVPVTVSREWVRKLKGIGGTVEYVEYPGVGHNSWEKAYQDEFVFDWFAKFKRNKFPQRVRFSSRRYEYNTAYWVTLDRLRTGKLASIDANFTGQNKLNITTGDLDGFTLMLEGHPQFDRGKPLEVTVDGSNIRVTPDNGTISFSAKGGKWVTGKYEAAPTSKKSGLEGPLFDAFSSRQIYVYGTAGNPSEEELRRRQDIATQAADWSFYRGWFLGRIMFFPRIVADKDVRPSDLESSDLILFGTARTNLLVDKFKDRLPIAFTADESKHGLFYVFPVNDHYVAVNSGLPWWTGSPQRNYRFPPAFAEVPDLKDFVLFTDNLKNVVIDGYFDQQWQLDEATKRRLVESGLVSVH